MLQNNKKGLGTKILEKSEGTLTSINFLEKYLDLNTSDILSFSETCPEARRISFEAIKKSLLTAAVCGNEDLVRKIVTSRPGLLLDSSAIVSDLSGKKITNLTPLQALICAGDVDMVQMIIKVLQHKPQVDMPLSFNLELEIQHQIATIYPNEDINAKEAEQIATAQEFKTSMLRDIFAAINADAATPELVKFELDNPGQHTGSDLNTALHNFRTQFATTANSEKIFNPFYLLRAFEHYGEQFDNFNGNDDDKWNKRNLFWRQVIGYIQRHLPACYLQAFAQGIFYIAFKGEELRRDFNFRHDQGFYMKANAGDFENLGYKYAVGGSGGVVMALTGNGGLPPVASNSVVASFSSYIRKKKSGWENLFTRRVSGSFHSDPQRLCVIA